MAPRATSGCRFIDFEELPKGCQEASSFPKVVRNVVILKALPAIPLVLKAFSDVPWL